MSTAPKFIPVFHESTDGLQIFRNDLVDIQFDVDGGTVTKQFDLSEHDAPPLPFAHTGTVTINDEERVYAVDAVGGAWLEDLMFEQMWPIQPRALIRELIHSTHPAASAVLALVQAFEEEDEAEVEA